MPFSVAVATVLAIALVAGVAPAGATLAAPAGAPSWQRDTACGRDLGAPVAATRDGCAAAHCIEDAGVEVCACRPRDADASLAPDHPLQGAVRFTVRRDGDVSQSWPRDTMLGETSAFRVARADLDSDGSDEIVIGALGSVSNGMAVQTWSLCVLDGRDSSRKPACAEVDDYPFLGMLTEASGKRACRVLETRWRWGAERKRGDGLYLVGRWLDYAHGELRPDATRPTIARRYLYRFAAPRAAAIESASTAPILWFRDPTTRIVRCPDPLCAGEGNDAPAAATAGGDAQK